MSVQSMLFLLSSCRVDCEMIDWRFSAPQTNVRRAAQTCTCRVSEGPGNNFGGPVSMGVRLRKNKARPKIILLQIFVGWGQWGGALARACGDWSGDCSCRKTGEDVSNAAELDFVFEAW